jgi:hypothetical protein
MPDATQEGVIPTVAREGGVIAATELDFDERQQWLGSMPEEERTAMIAALPMKVRMEWINEEREHLEAAVSDQPIEGADFTGKTDEEIIVPGSEKPEDRAPDVGEALIAGLVKEKFEAEQKATAAVSLRSQAEAHRVEAEQKIATIQRELDEANDKVQRYYEQFGPLTERV